jgi:hypothetical protein
MGGCDWLNVSSFEKKIKKKIKKYRWKFFLSVVQYTTTRLGFNF